MSVEEVRITGVTRRPLERPWQAQAVAFGDAPSASDVRPGALLVTGLNGLASERQDALDTLAGNGRLVRHWRYRVGNGKIVRRASSFEIMLWVLSGSFEYRSWMKIA